VYVCVCDSRCEERLEKSVGLKSSEEWGGCVVAWGVHANIPRLRKNCE